MSVPARFILSQSIGLRALGGTAFRAIMPSMKRPGKPTVPGREYKATIAPPSRALIDTYVTHVGGDPAAYQGTIPPHLFPQWAFLLMSRALAGIPYPAMRLVNGGCRLEVRRPLPADEPLQVSAQLESIEADERKAVMTVRIVTGTASAPEALVARMNTIVVLGGRKKGTDGPRLVVPAGATELALWDLDANAGLEYAKLAGDFNPIHWIPRYAKAMGFKNMILHGFANMARTHETLTRTLLHGDPWAISEMEVRFTKPLVLPAHVGVFVKEHAVYTASGIGEPPYLEGRFTLR